MAQSQLAAERKRVAKANKQALAMVRRKQTELDLECRAELIAPRHMRQPVTDHSGRTVRGAMVIVDGARVRRANVLDRLRAYAAEREARGLSSLITARRVKAAERLALDHAEVGAGVGVATSDYLRSMGSNGNAGNAHGAIGAQIATRERLLAALAWCGSFVDIIAPIVFDGIDVRSWANARGYDRQQAVGYLAAALERLACFYDPPRVSAGNGASALRMAEVASATVDGRRSTVDAIDDCAQLQHVGD